MGELHKLGADLLTGFQPGESLSFAHESLEQLQARAQRMLEIGLHGLGFSAYVAGQSPKYYSELTEAQIRWRLKTMAHHTRWIRTFSCGMGNGIAPRVAKEFGLKTMVGAWIDGDEEKDAEEIEAVIEIAQAGHADLIAVGNEVLLRGDMEQAQLIELIQSVQERVDVPVGYVDAYFLFVNRPELVEVCDFLPLNCYPFWEGIALERAVPYAQEMVRRVQGVSGGKPVMIAETGWPTAGRSEREAMPSLRNMLLYLLNIALWTDDEELPLFWFSAFDEAWKIGPEGDCGAFWGLWDAEGESKLAP